MYIPESFHHANTYLAIAIGSILNGTLLWLIVNRTPTAMHPYRPVLLLSTLTDVVYMAVYWLVEPVLITGSDGRSASFSISWLGQSAFASQQPTAFILLAAWLSLFMFMVYSVSVPFIFRYALICHDKKWGPKHFAVMLTVPLVVVFVHMTLIYHAGFISTENQQVAQTVFFGDDNTKNYFIATFVGPKASSRLPQQLFLVSTLLSYSLIATLSWAIYRRLSRLAALHLSSNSARQLNSQLSTALLTLALIPLAVEFAPAVLQATSGIVGVQLGTNAYTNAAYVWPAVLNPLATLCIVKAYRMESIRLLKRIKAPCRPQPSITAAASAKMIIPAISVQPAVQAWTSPLD